MKKNYISAIAILLVAAIIAGIAGNSFYAKRHFQEDVVVGEGVTETVKLSTYNENLKGTIGDVDVYVMKGEQEGGSVLILGGTHANASRVLKAVRELVAEVK